VYLPGKGEAVIKKTASYPKSGPSTLASA